MGKNGSPADISFNMGFPNIPRKLCIGIDAIDFPLEPNLVDELSVEEKEEILLEEYEKYSLSKEENLIRHDKKAKSVDWFPIRESVFTVLGKQGGSPVITKDQSVIDRSEAKKTRRKEQNRIHLERMKNDPEYAAMRDIERALMSGESTENPFLYKSLFN